MIYCVEDDSAIRELLLYTLHNSGFEAKGLEDGEALFAEMAREKPALILLDVMLPGENGIEILKRIRLDASTRSIPVIMLTAKSSEYDKVIGLDSGADDYVCKPFGMMELISRIKAVLRRTSKPDVSETLVCGNVALNIKGHSVTVDGKPVELTLKEFELLKLLVISRGKVLTRDFLLDRIWGYEFYGETRTVDVHIRHIRQKLGDDAHYIETIRGVGYKFNDRQENRL